MRLHVLTAVSRPENLPVIADSLGLAASAAPEVRVAWHWRFDLERQHVGGQAVKNALLDGINGGWCWCLDDDTLVHPDLLAMFQEALRLCPDAGAVVVSQRRTTGSVLQAQPHWMVPGGVDIGQAIIRRSVIGQERIPISYEGDGMFLQSLLPTTKTVYLPEVLSLHNAISGVDVSV
jgi:hypothetical protein